MSQIKVLIPLPSIDFDPTEVAVPQRILLDSGLVDITFATPTGKPAECDPLLLVGPLFGQLGALAEAKKFYNEMIKTKAFLHPLSYDQIKMEEYDGILLAGGHAKGMKEYLGSTILQDKIAHYFPFTQEGSETPRVVASVCHGPLLIARSMNDGKSVLHGRRTTCLPLYMERTAYFLSFWKLGDYYRTYPEYVEAEIKNKLEEPGHFVRGPLNLFGNMDKKVSFVHEDGNYISGRWPGDAYLLGEKFLEKLKKIKEIP